MDRRIENHSRQTLARDHGHVSLPHLSFIFFIFNIDSFDSYHQCREDMIQVLRKAMTVPVNMGGISEKDFHQAVILLDNADQER